LEKGLFTYVVLGFLVWAMLGSLVAAYYSVQYDTYKNEYNSLVDQLNTRFGNVSAMLEGISPTIDIFLSYGNGTIVWQNNTTPALGSTAFTVLYLITDNVNYTDFGGELGILVTSINGVANNNTHGWFYWLWNSQNPEWILPEKSSAKYILHDGDTIAYTYASYKEWPPPPPT